MKFLIIEKTTHFQLEILTCVQFYFVNYSKKFRLENIYKATDFESLQLHNKISQMFVSLKRVYRC